MNTKGQLLTQAGVPYQTLIVPACTYMPLETLQAIARLAERGAKVVLQEKYRSRYLVSITTWPKKRRCNS